MTRLWFLMTICALAAALVLVRATLPQMGMDGPLAGRLDTINFSIALCVIAVTVMVILRLRTAGMSLWWGVAVFLWLAACEPALRELLGGVGSFGGYPGTIDNWFELPIMLIALIVFLGVIDTQPERNRAMFVAEGVAWFATIARPFVVIGGIDRLPLIGDVVSLSGDVLTFFLRVEYIFNAAKGLLVFPPVLGDAILLALFVGALVVAAVARNSNHAVLDRLRAN